MEGDGVIITRVQMEELYTLADGMEIRVTEVTSGLCVMRALNTPDELVAIVTPEGLTREISSPSHKRELTAGTDHSVRV